MSGIVRLNQLPEGSGNLTSDDIFMFMDDPSGSAVTKKISLSDLNAVMGGAGESVMVAGSGTGSIVGLPTANTNTASGAYSVISGGKNNTASGDYATVNGGFSNVASGLYSVVGGGGLPTKYAGLPGNTAAGDFSTVSGGLTNTANGVYSVVAGGVSNTTSSDGSYGTVSGGVVNAASGSKSTVSGGQSNTASGEYSIVGGGYTNTASGGYSVVVGGYSAVADRTGMEAFANGGFSANGDAQRVDFVLRISTTSATPATMMLDGASSRLTIPSGKALFATVTVAGIINGGSKAVHYCRKVAIKNVAGTTALIGTVSTVGTDVEDDAAYDVAITADNTNDALQINVTGKASETIRWVAHVEGVEIAYG